MDSTGSGAASASRDGDPGDETELLLDDEESVFSSYTSAPGNTYRFGDKNRKLPSEDNKKALAWNTLTWLTGSLQLLPLVTYLGEGGHHRIFQLRIDLMLNIFQQR